VFRGFQNPPNGITHHILRSLPVPTTMENVERPHISLVVIGHVDSGKSTVAGHLLFNCGCVDDRTLTKYEREAFELGKHPSTKYAWILDAMKAERERDMTIDISLWKFHSLKFDFTVIDVPGHRDYVKNMITGTSQADVAILVIDATKGGYELGMSKEGQSREHTLLAHTLGVKQLIVAINKMDDDTVRYAEKRYTDITDEVSKHLKKVGYKLSKVAFIPISGWKGDNLSEKSENNMEWYNGQTLLEALDNLSPPKRSTGLPLRIPIQDVYKIGGIGTVPVGRVESGRIRPGMIIQFAPSGIQAKVQSCEVHHEEQSDVGPGNNVGFSLRGVAVKDVRRGDVASEANDNAATAVSSFEAQIVVINHPGRITKGYCPVVDCHTAHISCQFVNIRQKLDRRTGKVVEENPEYLQNGDAAIVTMVPTRPMCVESFSEYQALGRITIRDMKRTVAVGIIKSIIKVEVDAEQSNVPR